MHVLLLVFHSLLSVPWPAALNYRHFCRLPPSAPQLIRALSLSWSPAPIPIPRRGRSNCHKTPTALDTKSTHTQTHTDTSCNEKVFLNFLHFGMGDHFWVRCGVFPFFVVVFFGIFCRLMRREGRRRKWVIYIFDELSLLNATNQTCLPSFLPRLRAAAIETGSNAWQSFCLLQNKYNLLMWQLTDDVAPFFVYQWHFLNINNGLLFLLPSYPQYLLLFIDIFFAVVLTLSSTIRKKRGESYCRH